MNRLAVFVAGVILYAMRDPRPAFDPQAFKRDCFEAKNLLEEFLKWEEF